MAADDNSGFVAACLVGLVAFVGILVILAGSGVTLPKLALPGLNPAIMATGSAVSTKCIDTDGGRVYDVKGTVTAGRKTYTDACSSSTMLVEKYCNAKQAIASENHQCPYGCSDGACKPSPVCGDGIVESGESCDLQNLNGQTCTSQGYYGGTLSCDPACKLDLSGCTNCGNGVINSGEECDGTNLGGKSCSSFDLYGDKLRCTSQCVLDMSQCLSSSCSDSDGEAIYNSGYVTYNNYNYYDYCTDYNQNNQSMTVVEMICLSNTEMSSEVIPCPSNYNCIGGACR